MLFYHTVSWSIISALLSHRKLVDNPFIPPKEFLHPKEWEDSLPTTKCGEGEGTERKFGTVGAERSPLSSDFNRKQRFLIKKSEDNSDRKSKHSSQ
jgi:hypothetical protein